MDLTAIAAVAAAALSAVNVALSYRLARRGPVEQWRREQERPIIARVLTISSDMLNDWLRLADAGEVDEAQDAKRISEGGMKLYQKLRLEAAQLELLAGPQVREAVRDLTWSTPTTASWPSTVDRSSVDPPSQRPYCKHCCVSPRCTLGW